MKILTLDDLYTYFSSQGKSITFSAGNGDVIVVGVHGKMNFKKSENDVEGLMPVILQACHTNKNNNGSKITEKSMKKALPSFANRPILAFIHKVDDQDEFGWHAMHLDEDDNLVYDEIPVGIIPESNHASLEYSEDKDKYYVNIDGYIFEEYSKAKDILERDGEAAVSVELGVRELSYDAKEKVLCIDDFYFEGVTILGVDEDGHEVKPGMEGSNIKLSDFSKNNTIFNSDEKLLEQLEMLNKNLEAFNIDNKGRKEDETVKFEELLKKYGVTVDDITFEYDGLSDEELEAKFEEVFGDNASEEDPTSDNFEEESESDETGEDEADDDNASEDFEEDSSEEDTSEEEDIDDEDVEDDFSVTYSVTRKGVRKDFEISMTQVISALSDLVNATYGETDDAWYSVDVYEDSKSVIMIDYWRNKAFKQSYKVRNGQYTLVGDRVEVYSQWLTSDEISELDKMRSNYSSISDRLNKYVEAEEDQSKMAIFGNEDYAVINESEDFTNLIEHRAEFSVEDVQKKCDELLLKYVKENNKFSSQNNENGKHNFIKLPLQSNDTKKKKGKGRYGNLFSRESN